MNHSKRIYLSPPHMSGDEQSFIQQAFDSNWIAPLGENVVQFENEICRYTGSPSSLAVSSGTAAIHLALILLGVSRNDYVICQSLTFVATANPILYQGAQPVFIDSEPDTWNMSPAALEKALYKMNKENCLPKAVIIVNLLGQSAKYEELCTIAEYYQVPVIEDAAESLGSSYKGKKCGTFGKFGILSFNGNKIITTSGGGMLLSDDHEALARAKFLATQARDPAIHYEHSQTGFNYRMSNILAGIGRGQLLHIEERVEARREIFNRYKSGLSTIDGLDFMPELPDSKSNRWLTALTLSPESNLSPPVLLHALEKENIESRPIWKPLHTQPLFRGSPYFEHENGRDFANQLFQTGICLPSGSSLTLEEQEKTIEIIKITLKQSSV
ncbi:aminotransferase class I/II-fold pyridoxal phosphate-dependent enzyme [Falsibacillus pallidus]|uniref:Pyridoxal phosphate-dependent aminotransferase EpsN n=1 Tax=Falsibacillus pallidus TaxID=493781 RepID=A0A370GYK6_9BACI|nr:aminotransferase class I/II-fold pyridoxal phosphate-dependent enzyme [Falsibacillus pallidus]RDI47724.1 pyridoxal phosphate-dependent aminotransferase EpsN [Falsibacillus pallidus]